MVREAFLIVDSSGYIFCIIDLELYELRVVYKSMYIEIV